MTNSNPNFNPNIDETDSAESNIAPIEQLTEDNKQNIELNSLQIEGTDPKGKAIKNRRGRIIGYENDTEEGFDKDAFLDYKNNNYTNPQIGRSVVRNNESDIIRGEFNQKDLFAEFEQNIRPLSVLEKTFPSNLRFQLTQEERNKFAVRKEDGSIDHAATDRKFAVLGENKYARASVAGIANIPNELYKIGRYIGGDRTPDNLYALQDLGLELEDDKDDFAYQTTKFLAGFLLPYAGLSKTGKVLSGWKMLKGVNGLGLANPAFRSFVAGSIAETIAIDAYDENFFNFLIDIDTPYLDFAKPLFDVLAADETRTEDLGIAKLRQFLAGGVFGEVLGYGGSKVAQKLVLEPIGYGAKATGNGALFLADQGSQVIRRTMDEFMPPTILSKEQIRSRTIQLLKDIKANPKRLEFFKKQIDILNNANVTETAGFVPKEMADEITELDRVARRVEDLIARGDLVYAEGALDFEPDADSMEYFTQKIFQELSEGTLNNQRLDDLLRQQPLLTFKQSKDQAFTRVSERLEGLRSYRGIERTERYLNNLARDRVIGLEEVDEIRDFLNFIGREAFDDIVLEQDATLSQATLGNYNFNKSLIKLRNTTIKEGRMSEVLIHELWHSLSRNLPDKQLRKLTGEFARARNKFLQDHEAAKKAFIEKTSIQEMQLIKNLEAFNQPGRITSPVKVTKENFNRLASKYYDKEFKFVGDSYQFLNIDEYFAVNMTKMFEDYVLELETLAPRGTFKYVTQIVAEMFRDTLASIRSVLGLEQTKNIFNMYKRRMFKQRLSNYPLEFRNLNKMPTELEATLNAKMPGDKGFKRQRIKARFNRNLYGDGQEITIAERVADNLLDLDPKAPFRMTHAETIGYAHGELPEHVYKDIVAAAGAMNTGNPTKRLRVKLLRALNLQKEIIGNMKTNIHELEKYALTGSQIPQEIIDEVALDSYRWIKFNTPTKKVVSEVAGTLDAIKLVGKEPPEGAISTKLGRRKKDTLPKGNIKNQVAGTLKRIEEEELLPKPEEIAKAISDMQNSGDIEGILTYARRMMILADDPKQAGRFIAKAPLTQALFKTGSIANELFINSILSAPETQIVNTIGSLFNVALAPVDLFLGSGIADAALKGRAIKEFTAMFSTLEQSFIMAGKALRGGESIIDPHHMLGVQDGMRGRNRYAMRFDNEMNNPFIATINLIGSVARLPSRFLIAGDELIKNVAFRSHVTGEFYEQAYRQGLKGDAMKKYIQEKTSRVFDIVEKHKFSADKKNKDILEAYLRGIDFAQDKTFTSQIGGSGITGLGGGKFTNDVATIMKHPVMKPIAPFVTTPVNIGKSVIRRAGVSIPGQPKMNATLGRILAEHNDRLFSPDMATRMRANGESITGGLLIGSFVTLAIAADNPEAPIALVGGGTTFNPEKRRQTQFGFRELPYSFRFLKKTNGMFGEVVRNEDGSPQYVYIDFISRLEPIASLLMLASDFANVSKFQGEEDDRNLAATLRVLVGNNLSNKYFIQSVGNLFELMNNPTRLESWLRQPANYIAAIGAYPIGLKKSLRRARGEDWTSTLGQVYENGKFIGKGMGIEKGELDPQEISKVDAGNYEEDFMMGLFPGNDLGSLKTKRKPFLMNSLDILGTMVMHTINNDLAPRLNPLSGKPYENFGTIPFVGGIRYSQSSKDPNEILLKKYDLKLVPVSDILSENSSMVVSNVNLKSKELHTLENLTSSIKIDTPYGNNLQFSQALYKLQQTTEFKTFMKNFNTPQDDRFPDNESYVEFQNQQRRYMNNMINQLYRAYKEQAVNVLIDRKNGLLSNDFYDRVEAGNNRERLRIMNEQSTNASVQNVSGLEDLLRTV